MSESASAAQSTRSCSSPNASSAPVREARLQRSRYSAISASRSAFSSQKMSSWRAMRSAKRLRRNIRSPSGSPGGVILDVAGNFPKPPFGGPVAAACCVSYLEYGGGRRRIPSAVADEPALVRGLGRLPEPHLGPRPRNVAGRGLGHLRAAGRGRSVVLLHPLGLRAGLGRPSGRLVAGLLPSPRRTHRPGLPRGLPGGARDRRLGCAAERRRWRRADESPAHDAAAGVVRGSVHLLRRQLRELVALGRDLLLRAVPV